MQVFFLAGYPERVWLCCFCLSVAIIFGVLGLSVFKCELLQEALDTLSGSVYCIGNFLVHYYPCLRLYAARPAEELVGAQASFSLAILVCYLASHRANIVYGCPLSTTTITWAALLAIPVTVIVHVCTHPQHSKTLWLQVAGRMTRWS